MFKQIKERLKEIAEIADGCPSQYREKCFSILLERYLSSIEKVPAEKPSEVPPAAVEKLPMGLSRDVMTRIFHIEGGKYKIIVKDLKVKPKAKKQVKLALLLGMKNKMETGTPLIPREELSQICPQYGALEINIKRNINRRRDLFIEKGDTWKLTILGEQKAREIIEELASVGEQK